MLADDLGTLHILVVNKTGVRLAISPIGQTVQASCLAYINSNLVFVGSHFGDSQFVEPATEVGQEVSTIQTLPNLAPAIDFCIVDLEKEGQGQIVACSGAYADGSLRIIRNGIGIEEFGALDGLNQVNGVWALKPSFDAE